MLKYFINSHLASIQKAATSFQSRLSPFQMALATSGSNNYIFNMKTYDIKPDEPVLEPEEQPGYYNVYDEDEFPGESSDIPIPETPKDLKIESPLNTTDIPPRDKDAKGPSGEGVL